MLSRRVTIAIASGAVAGLTAVGSFGPIVRHQAAGVAERYGATLEADRVGVVWGGARLEGVRIELAEVPGVVLRFDEIRVQYGWDGRAVSLRGGALAAVGELARLYDDAARWKDAHLSGRRGEGGEKRSLALEPIDVEWKDRTEAPRHAARIVGLDVARQEDGSYRFEAKRAEVDAKGVKLAVTGGRVGVKRQDDGRLSIQELRSDAIDATVGVTPDLPGVVGAAGAGATEGGSGAIDKARRLRAVLQQAGRALESRLAPDAVVSLQGLSARLQRGDETLSLGPGTFEVRRGKDRSLQVELKPGLESAEPGATERPLMFAVALPLDDESDRPLEVRVDGGPIHLSTLGIQEGDLGLLDVHQAAVRARAHLALAADGRRLSFDGEGTIDELSLESKYIAVDPVRGLEVAFRGKGDVALDGRAAHVEDGELRVGDVRLLLTGNLERVERGDEQGYSIDSKFEVPLTACQSMLDSAPEGLIPVVKGMRMAGSFAIAGHAKLDTTSLDRGFDVDWDSSNSCRITEVPAGVSVSRFRGPFKRTAYDGHGLPTEVETGPTTPHWVPYSAVSRFMEVAVITCEDGRFFRHDGFDDEAIRNSVRENLRAKKFVRGASTISMQLAKNLYLKRHKTVSRKLQEAILTMYLEQELTKEQILELYLNVVEFGPDLYGIGPAASHYFNSSPGRLSVGQAFYLGSILPSPKQQHFGAGGAVTSGWMTNLHTLMRYANKRNRLSDEDLEEGLSETVVRGSPAPVRAVSEDETADPFQEGVAPWEGPPETWLAP